MTEQHPQTTSGTVEKKRLADAQKARDLIARVEGDQGEYLTTWRFTVADEDVKGLVDAQPKAIAFTKSICPELKSAELLDTGGGTWLHMVRWSTPDAYPMLTLRLLANDHEAAQAGTLDAFLTDDEFIGHGKVVTHA